MGREFTIKLVKMQTQIDSLNTIYEKMNQCNNDVEGVYNQLDSSVKGKVSNSFNTVFGNADEILNSLKQMSSILEEIVEQYQNTENCILANKISRRNIDTVNNVNNGDNDNDSGQDKANEAYNNILDLMDQYEKGKLDILSLFMNIASILEYIGDDLDALDDFIRLVGVENAADLTKLGKEIGESELSSWLSLIARAYENGSAVYDGDIRWDQALRYYGLELLGDLGKDTVVGITGPYGFAAFAVIDAISISKNGEDAVAWLAHTVDDNVYEKWYQSQ